MENDDQQNLAKMADWLVANKHKKGSADFNTVAEAFKELHAKSQGGGSLQPPPAAPEQPQQNFLTRGADQVTEDFATGAKALGFEGTASTLSNLIETPQTPSSSQKYMESGDLNELPSAVGEQLPGIGLDLATRGAGFAVAGPIGAVAAPAVLNFARSIGPEAIARARNNGRETPELEDWLAASGTASVNGLLSALGVGGKLGIGGTAAREAITGYLNNLVSQVGETAGTDKGLTVDLKQADRGAILSGTTGAAAGIPFTAARGAKALKKLSEAPPEDPDTISARRTAANLIREASTDHEGGTLDLGDTRSAKEQNSAIQARKSAHIKVAENIKALRSALKDQLTPEDNTSVDGILDSADLNATFRESLNEYKGSVSKSGLKKIQDLVGGTQEGDELVHWLRVSNQLTEVARKGVKGGVTQYTDKFSPFSLQGGAIATIGGLATGGLLTKLQTGAWLGGKAIDKATGLNKPIKRFVSKNEGPELYSRDQSLPTVAAERAKSKLAALAEKANKKQAEELDFQQRKNLFTKLYQMQRSGTLTPDDIEANRGMLTNAQYKLFYDNLDKAKAKSESDALKQDRAVVRQGEIMGKQRQVEEKQGLVDLTTGMKMTARGRAQEAQQAKRGEDQTARATAALELENQRAQARQDKADQVAAKREAKSELEATLKEGTDLANSGGLSEDWLTSNRDRLSPSQYASFAGKLARQREKAAKAAERAKAPEAGKAPRAPRAPKVVEEPTAPIQAAPAPRENPVKPADRAQTFIEYPEAWQRQVDKAERLRSEISQTADLAESSGRTQLAATLRVAVEALDTMKRDKRNVPKKRERKIEKLRDTLDTAEDQTMFEDVMAPFRDLFTDELTLKKAKKKIRKLQGMTEETLPDVPFDVPSEPAPAPQAEPQPVESPVLHATETKEFNNWFSDSKVVDDNEDPKVMYHGSTLWEAPLGEKSKLGDFDVFNRKASSEIVGRPASYDTVGSWFSDSPDPDTGAGLYAGSEGVMYPVYLSIKNPYHTSFKEMYAEMLKGSKTKPKFKGDQKKTDEAGVEAYRNRLIKEGYDGIKFDNSEKEFEKQNVWIAFEPTQIKSAIGNKGTFDPKDPNITK